MKSMRTKPVIILILIVAAGAALVWVMLKKQEEPAAQTEQPQVEEAGIRLFGLAANDTIASPLALSGEARGTWYFEASFPVRMLDANGRELGVTPVQAQSEWMTVDYVPFEGTLEFETPTTETGTLVLEKDNPSGLPEYAGEIRIPVRFERASETMSLNVFFSNSVLDPEVMDCSRVFPVERTLPKTEAPARAAIVYLSDGPFSFCDNRVYYKQYDSKTIAVRRDHWHCVALKKCGCRA